MAFFLETLLGGLMAGMLYSLVALGFVLIYKATELVNFAQGDLLMLGAFVCYMAVVWWGFDYWLAFALAIVVIGIFGAGHQRAHEQDRLGKIRERELFGD